MTELVNTLNILIDKIDKLCALEKSSDLDCYKVQQVAEILQCNKTSVYNMINSGKLPAFTVGNNGSKKPEYRITRDALESFMQSSCNPKGGNYEE